MNLISSSPRVDVVCAAHKPWPKSLTHHDFSLIKQLLGIYVHNERDLATVVRQRNTVIVVTEMGGEVDITEATHPEGWPMTKLESLAKTQLALGHSNAGALPVGVGYYLKSVGMLKKPFTPKRRQHEYQR